MPQKATTATTDLVLKHSFPPVVDGRTRVLVLGSLPGEASLAQGRYYAHPRNHFWGLIGMAIQADLAAMPYQDRLAALLAAGVGLWDVVASATRRGSLDAAIRDYRANALAGLTRKLPNLEAIAFNGGKAARIGRKALAGTTFDLIYLPSSSPAYTLPLGAKRARWAELERFLQHN